MAHGRNDGMGMKDYQYCVVDDFNCINHYCKDEKEVRQIIRKWQIPENLYEIKSLHGTKQHSVVTKLQDYVEKSAIKSAETVQRGQHHQREREVKNTAER